MHRLTFERERLLGIAKGVLRRSAFGQLSPMESTQRDVVERFQRRRGAPKYAGTPAACPRTGEIAGRVTKAVLLFIGEIVLHRR